VNEIRFYEGLGERPGILPIIDSYVPEPPIRKGADLPWLVMPIATPIRDHFGSLPDVREVVHAIAEVADALAALAPSGISHRDVKPENMYQRDGAYLIGDFGLVDVPDQETLTMPGRSLGPWGFMAPEMMTAADTADGRQADVFSLAKTLWVLALDQRWPPLWQIRTDNPRDCLSGQISGPRLHLLDRLIERATMLDPSARPSMAGFRDELGAWMRMPTEPGQPADLSELAQRLITASAPAQQELLRRAEWGRQANETLARLAHIVSIDIGSRVREAGLEPLLSHGTGSEIMRFFPDPGRLVGGPETLVREGRGFVLRAPKEPGGLTHVLYAEVLVTALSDGNIELAAQYVVAQQMKPGTRLIGPEQIGATHRSVPVGTAAEDNAVAEIATALSSHLGEAMQHFVERAER
jgi:hypothetical protein